MPGRIIMTVSAAALFLIGGAGLFAAPEAAGWLGATETAPTSIIVQLAACAVLALAVMNWYSRNSRVGGIYARPLCLGNLLFFFGAAACVGKAVTVSQLPGSWLALLLGFSLPGLAFAWLIFFHDPLPEPAARS
jgi:uncharacterized membrane protein YgdD (TMEM256/DUF423 family)